MKKIHATEWNIYMQTGSVETSEDKIGLNGRFAVLITTPFCGTCKLAKQMVEIVSESRPNWPIFELDVTDCQAQVEAWRIQSVPYILVIENRIVLDQWARIGSVTDLWQRLSKFLP